MSRHILAAGLIISVAYAAVHIAFADATLLTGAAPLRLSVRNYPVSYTHLRAHET